MATAEDFSSASSSLGPDERHRALTDPDGRDWANARRLEGPRAASALTAVEPMGIQELEVSDN